MFLVNSLFFVGHWILSSFEVCDQWPISVIPTALSGGPIYLLPLVLFGF